MKDGPLAEWAGALKYVMDENGKEMILDADGGQVQRRKG
jgi:hypothetical protein